MANKERITISPEELFGAVRASQFVLVELAISMGAERHLRDRIVRMEEALWEKGLISNDDGRVIATKEEFPILFQGMQDIFQSYLTMIESRLPPDSQLELFSSGEHLASETEHTEYHSNV